MTEIADDDFCFVCGRNNPAGLHATLSMNPAENSAACRIVFDKTYQGWRDMIHGGILATILDEVCAYAGKTVAQHVVTAELTTRYKKPVMAGEEVLATARVVERRRRVLTIAARLEVAGELRVEADARMFIATG